MSGGTYVGADPFAVVPDISAAGFDQAAPLAGPTGLADPTPSGTRTGGTT